ncbi:hypothetical protein [Acetivibrio ethanolgignens]|uniref:Uncharacterized protein n=1 Tax=Acetivibrio ethanolgignens TaxID=290052 RepID=A0A0V8QEW6_9FIRM|nr:hypothetical protein [Acetivibrio ethanolgignens]KSV59135.1 hypothetical protein ASU35_10265 [Acetivibrio ethanolgignens]
MAKLILVDNFCRESVADVLLEENLAEATATQKAVEYNDKYRSTDWSWFAKAVPDDYKLWGGISELI